MHLQGVLLAICGDESTAKRSTMHVPVGVTGPHPAQYHHPRLRNMDFYNITVSQSAVQLCELSDICNKNKTGFF